MHPLELKRIVEQNHTPQGLDISDLGEQRPQLYFFIPVFLSPTAIHRSPEVQGVVGQADSVAAVGTSA